MQVCTQPISFGSSAWYFRNYRAFSWNLPAGDFFKKKFFFRVVAYFDPMFGVGTVARAPLTHDLPWYAVVNAIVWLALFVAGAAWRMSKDTARV